MASGKQESVAKPSAPAWGAPIPDFCRWKPLLALMLAVQVVALVFTLLSPGSAMEALVRLVLISLYLLLICLISAAALCMLRKFAAAHAAHDRYREVRVFLIAWLLIIAVAMIVSTAGYGLAREFIDPAYLSDESRAVFVLRNALIAALVGAMLLRYFSARAQWEDNVRTESEARYQSLSARIRPHFLFNSLNSIAALIAIKPAAAETMVEDLADLFRASLAKGDPLVMMEEELDLVRKFARIEQTRLGARLGIDWDIPEAVMPMSIPRLTIQPLVENAVHHGAARTTGPVTIVVRARLEEDLLIVEVINPLPPNDDPGHTGSQTAVANIAQRVRLLYGARAALSLLRGDGSFCARLELPARRLTLEKQG